jgi:hypothetical protein
MARATTQPAGFEDHPMSEDTEEPNEVESPSDADEAGQEPTPERHTRSKTRGSNQAGDNNDQEEESEGDGLSERDEALSEGESSYGDDSQFAGPPNLQ